MTVSHRTHYGVLGVTPDVDATQLRAAWRMLMQVWHPDRFDGELRTRAERMTADINEAYGALRDEDARARYDREISSTAKPAQSPRPPAAAPPPRPIATPQPASAVSLDTMARDMLSALRNSPRLVATAAVVWVVLLAAFGMQWLQARPPATTSLTSVRTSSLEATPAPSPVMPDVEPLTETQAPVDPYAMEEEDIAPLPPVRVIRVEPQRPRTKAAR